MGKLSMDKNSKQFKTSGVSQCWHCSRQLVRIKGGFKYSEIEGPLGNRMRVHKDCLQEAVGDGIREVKEPA